MDFVDLDAQAIERRDFPIARRGYEPAEVDAHLHRVAAIVAELTHKAQRDGSMGVSAAAQVQGILDAAHEAASKILREAQAKADRTLQEANLAAQHTQGEAIETAKAHVSAVAEAASALRGKVETMDANLQGLAETLRSGGARLTHELGTLEREMAALYAAASGRDSETVAAAKSPAFAPAGEAEPEPWQQQVAGVAIDSPKAAGPESPIESSVVSSAGSEETVPRPQAEQGSSDAQADGDLDGARLIALNMALNGDSREATNRYLAEHFDLAERAKLIDEVYAAIGG